MDGLSAGIILRLESWKARTSGSPGLLFCSKAERFLLTESQNQAKFARIAGNKSRA